jgi:hypothetical protein
MLFRVEIVGVDDGEFLDTSPGKYAKQLSLCLCLWLSMNGYVVFSKEESARAALAHNMTEVCR